MKSETSRVRTAAWRLLGVVLALTALALAASPRGALAAARTSAETTAAAGTSPAAIAPADSTPATDTSGTPVTTSTPSSAPTRTVGYSVQGRPIVLETFGSGARHILVLGGIHGNEYGGPVTRKFAAYLRTHPSTIPPGTQVDVIAYANPDGTARGRRGNAHNVDINRNFPSRNWNRKLNAGGTSPGVSPGSEPETQALLVVLASGNYIRVLSMHSKGGILDYDGPGGWTTAKRMSNVSHVRLHRLGAYHGSMGSYIPETYHRPIVTWELSSRTLTTRVRSGMLTALK